MTNSYILVEYIDGETLERRSSKFKTYQDAKDWKAKNKPLNMKAYIYSYNRILQKYQIEKTKI